MLEDKQVTAPAATESNVQEVAQPKDTIEVVHSTEEAQPESGSDTPKEEGQTQEEPKQEPEKKPLNPRTAQRKAEKERLIRENATLAERLKELEGRVKQTNPASEQKSEKVKDYSKEPNIQDYDDVLEYQRDVAKYDLHQFDRQKSEQSEQAELQKYQASFNEELPIIKAEMPDFEEKVGQFYQAGLLEEGGYLEKQILKTGKAGELAKHFVQYPSDLQQLSMYRPEAIPAALKQIQDWIKTNGSASTQQQPEEQPRVTKAQAPITPPGNSAKSNRSINSYSQEEIENMPLKEYEALTRR